MFARPAILNALVKVARGKLDVMKFSHLWGTLGSGSSEAAQRHLGDSVDWIESHAETIERALTAHDLLRRHDTEAIRQMVEKLPQRAVAGLGRLTVPFFSFATPEAFALYQSPSARASDREIIEDVISETFKANLAGAHPSVRFELGEFRHVLVFSRPIVAVYWMAAAALSNELVRHCEYCGAPFVVKEPRQRYCPSTEPWQQASPCGANERKQKQRATTAQLRQRRANGPKKAAATDKRKRTI